MLSKKPILLIEDNEVDVKAIQRALDQIKVSNPLIAVTDGLKALDYLKDPKNARPRIILLDLNLPEMSGVEFLKATRDDREMRMIPVVVLSTSSDAKDKLDTFNLGVAGFIRKPLEYKDFVKVIKTINLYWSLSEIPD